MFSEPFPKVNSGQRMARPPPPLLKQKRRKRWRYTSLLFLALWWDVGSFAMKCDISRRLGNRCCIQAARCTHSPCFCFEYGCLFIQLFPAPPPAVFVFVCAVSVGATETASIGYEYFPIWFDGVGTFAVWISSTHGAFLYPRILFSLGLWQPLQTIIDTECGSFSCFYVFFSFAEDASHIANILDSGFFLRHSGAFAMLLWVFCYPYLFLRPAMQNFISRLGQPHSFLFYCVFFFLFWRKTESSMLLLRGSLRFSRQ